LHDFTNQENQANQENQGSDNVLRCSGNSIKERVSMQENLKKIKRLIISNHYIFTKKAELEPLCN